MERDGESKRTRREGRGKRESRYRKEIEKEIERSKRKKKIIFPACQRK